jgi:hypothetical protein
MEENTPLLEAHTDYRILSLEDKTPGEKGEFKLVQAFF